MPYGVPNPYAAATHPYPTRYHGGIWTRPVFGMPYQPAVQSVFKPTDFNDANPGLRGLGEPLFDVYDGVFGTQQQGGGVFGPSLYGLGSDCELPSSCVQAKASASQYFNTSLLDGYCDADSNAQDEIWGICNAALAKAQTVAATPAAPTPAQQMSFTPAQITALQNTLNTALVAAGYPKITADGKMGPGTCGAIAWYQKQTGNPTAGASFAAICATKQPWVAPSKSSGAPLPAGPSTYTAPSTFAYTPPSSGPSKATMFAVGGGILAAVIAVVGKKQGWF